MILLMILAILSVFLSGISYFLRATPILFTPILLLFSISSEPAVIAQYTAALSFLIQLLLILFIYLLRDSRRKLQSRLQKASKENIQLSEKTKNIESRLQEQGKEMENARTEAQKVLLLQAQVDNLTQLADEWKLQNGALLKRNEVLDKQVLAQGQSGSGKIMETLKSWKRKILP